MNIYKLENQELRRDLYDWFSISLDRPVEDNFNTNFIDTLKTISRPYGLDLEPEITMIREVITNPEMNNIDLLVDYSKLFIGPTSLLAPPYESFYRDNAVVMGDSTLEVIKAYRELGLELDNKIKDLPDHIAVELSFMVYLCQRLIETINNGDTGTAQILLKQQENFFNTHLNLWVRELTNRMKENAMTIYYKAVGSALEKFIFEENKFFNNLTIE